MNQLRAIRIFVEVARYGSFSAAGRAMRLSTSAVTRYVSELESWLGITLVQRSTRNNVITPAGVRYLEQCRQLLSEFDDVHRGILDQGADVHGTVRFTAPLVLGNLLSARAFPTFMRKHPGVSLDIHLNDRPVKLLEEGFDIALRIGRAVEANVVSQVVGKTELVIVASPEYLQANGVPQSPAALTEHECIVETVPPFFNIWPIASDDGSVGVQVPDRVVVNTGEAALELVLAGVGITILPDIFLQAALADGKLVRLLADHRTRVLPLHLLSPQARYTSRAVQSLTDHLADYWSAA